MTTVRSRAPVFPGGLEWFNVDGPVRLSEQRGKVVLIDFGSYCSVHCRHALADLRRLAGRYRDDLVIIGVHAPRFRSELRRTHVQKSINRHSIDYPVIHDPEHKLWNLYGIRVLPTQVLIDHEGYIVGALSGDGKAVRLEQVVSSLLGHRTGAAVTGRSSFQLKPCPEPKGVLNFPGRIVAARDKVYIVDSGNHRILVTSASGHVLRQYGGEGLFAFGEEDGIGLAARLQYPLDIKADQTQNMLWVADTYNNKIRRIGVKTRHVSSVLLDRRLDEPGGLAFSNNTLYIANTNAHEVLRLNPNNGQIEALNVTEEQIEI
jgi:peroxiredoxin